MNNYTEEVRRVFKQSELEALNNKDKEVSSSHILLSLLAVKTSLSSIFDDYNINYDDVKKHIISGDSNQEFVFYSKELLSIIEDVILKEDSLDEDISLVMIVTRMLELKDSKAYKILKKINVNIDKLINDLELRTETTNISFIKSIAINLNNLASSNMLDPVIGRDIEVNNLIRILARKNKNNPILIGEAGVGKTAIVEELARRIVKGEVPLFLKNSIIYNLNIASVIAGTKYRGEFEEKLTKIINELESNSNYIVFIDEVHTIMGAGGAEGAIDASNILKPALARGNLRLIGATTINEYKSSIEKDKALDRRFQKIMVEEPKNEELTNILIKAKSNYEKYHNVSISNDMLNLIIKLSNKYIKDRKNPDKSLDILDEVCALESLIKKESRKEKLIKNIEKLKDKRNALLVKGDFEKACLVKSEIIELENKLTYIKDIKSKRCITISSIKNVLESKINTPLYELDLDQYYNIIDLIKKDYNGYNLDNIFNIIKTFILNDINRPQVCNIDIDSTIIENLSKQMKYKLINIDMKDFRNSFSLNKIFGSAAGYVGYNEKNTVFENVKTFPVCFIYLDNYNYACKEVKDVIESIIDKGYLSLANGEKIDFNNTLIFKRDKNNKKSTIGFVSNNLLNINS